MLLIVLCDTKLIFFLFPESLLQYQLYHLMSDSCVYTTKLCNKNFLVIPFLSRGKFPLLAYIRNCLVANDAFVPPSLFLLYGLGAIIYSHINLAQVFLCCPTIYTCFLTWSVEEENVVIEIPPQTKEWKLEVSNYSSYNVLQ